MEEQLNLFPIIIKNFLPVLFLKEVTAFLNVQQMIDAMNTSGCTNRTNKMKRL